MKAYSLIQFLSEPISTIIENDDDYSFEYRNSEIGKTNSVGQFISRIKIPLIQRDYAQGRRSNKSLREEFLKNIFKYLEEEKELKLDFVYGSLERENGEIDFLPLDGQQRLTTLFLLHWYIIKKECNADKIKDFQNDFLKKFSYETRDTSRRFFINLADFDFLDNPKLEIEKAYWFSNYFKLDPTVSAAVNTLETIHELYNTSKYRGQLLSRLDLIVFYVLPMDQFKLTDDLYIKLNARGKVLSSFENFKADIIGFIKQYNRYQIEKEFSGLKLYSYDIIANKFDNKWADFFWKKARNDDSNKSIDGYFFRFIHKVLINEYIIAYNKKGKLNDDPTYKTLLEKEEELLYSTFDFYKKKEFLKSLEDFERLLDFYSKYSDVISSLIQPFWDENYRWDIFKSEFTMYDRMVFDAINSYALENEHFDEKKFKDWIRIVWNIIIDPDIRSIEANKAAMTFVRRISVYSSDILQNLKEGYLDDIINESKGIYSVQLKEEKEKAIRILSTRFDEQNLWYNIISRAEKHLLFTGNINFLIEIEDTPDMFSRKLEIAEKLFNEKGSIEILSDENHSLFRYVISKFRSKEEIRSIYYQDTANYWKLLLRRQYHNRVQEIILGLVKESNIEEIKNIVKISINNESNIACSKLHENLYLNNLFVKWYNENQLNVIWDYSNHLYLNKYNDKSGNRVLIDTFRNELVAKVLKLGFETKSSCANSGFYKGKNIECHMTLDNDIILTIEFTENDIILIGIWSEYNLNLKDPVNDQNYWIEHEKIINVKLDTYDEIEKVFKVIKELIRNPKFICPTNTQKIN